MCALCREFYVSKKDSIDSLYTMLKLKLTKIYI